VEFGGVRMIGFIDHERVVFKGKEAVREADRDEQEIAGFGVERATEAFAETGRTAAHVEDNIEHTTAQAIDKFGVGGGRELEMHAADDVLGGNGTEFFARCEGDAEVVELVRAESFDEETALILKEARAKKKHAGEVRG